jgi:hypothetical protein
MDNDPRLDQVRHWRARAEEFRAMAANMKDLGARALCLRVAVSYVDLADSEEQRVTGSSSAAGFREETLLPRKGTPTTAHSRLS